MYYKIEAIKIKMSLDKLYDELEAGKNLSTVFKELNKSYVAVDGTIDMVILDDILFKESSRIIRV